MTTTKAIKAGSLRLVAKTRELSLSQVESWVRIYELCKEALELGVHDSNIGCCAETGFWRLGSMKPDTPEFGLCVDCTTGQLVYNPFPYVSVHSQFKDAADYLVLGLALRSTSIDTPRIIAQLNRQIEDAKVPKRVTIVRISTPSGVLIA